MQINFNHIKELGELIEELTALKRKMEQCEIMMAVGGFENIVVQFIKENCVLGEGLKIQASKLYCDFNDYLDEKDFDLHVTNRQFYSVLRKLGFKFKRGSRNKYFIVGLNNGI